jgi:hypothetical protein
VIRFHLFGAAPDRFGVHSSNFQVCATRSCPKL